MNRNWFDLFFALGVVFICVVVTFLGVYAGCLFGVIRAC